MSIVRKQTTKRLSQVVVHNGTVFLAGQVANDLSSGIEQQVREVLSNVERCLSEAGTDKSRLLSATIYLKDVKAYFDDMNRVWDSWVSEGHAPARTTVEAKLCEPGILVEVTVVAALP